MTMLWLLKRPEWVEQCKAGRDLTDWVSNIMGIPLKVARSDEFQQEVLRVFVERGIRPIAPERVVDCWSKGPAKEMVLAAGWPKPFFPVMLQCRPGPDKPGSGAFIVFSSWQDAMIALAKISGARLYRGKDKDYPTEMVYENQVVDMAGYDYPCRLILDCDAKPSEFGDKYTVEELARKIDEVPAFFCKRLVEIGAIQATDRVVVIEKEKSRPGKASKHLVFNIMGFSTWDTQAVLREIFATELDKEKLADEKALAKGQTRLPFAGTLPAWKMVDQVPHHGRGQYSVLGFYDSKKGEVEYPCLTRRLEIVDGRVVSCKACKVSRAESGLRNNERALSLLHDACYTCFVPDFITMDAKFMVQRTAVSAFLPGFFLP